jgi:hypothetical protein
LAHLARAYSPKLVEWVFCEVRLYEERGRTTDK